MLTQAELGQQVEHKGKQWVVVRVVNSASLHRDEGKYHTLQENYLELRNSDSEVDFLILSSERKQVDISYTLALPNLPWRKENTNG